MSSMLNFSVTFSPRSPHPLGSLVPTVSSPKLRMGWSRIGIGLDWIKGAIAARSRCLRCGSGCGRDSCSGCNLCMCILIVSCGLC